MARARSKDEPARATGATTKARLPRHRCAVCNSYKMHAAFPVGGDGERALITCKDCLRGAQLWESEDENVPDTRRKSTGAKAKDSPVPDQASQNRPPGRRTPANRARNGVDKDGDEKMEDPSSSPSSALADFSDDEGEGEDALQVPAFASTLRTLNKRPRPIDNYFAQSNRPKRPRPKPVTEFTCRFCIEEKPVGDFVKWQNLSYSALVKTPVPPICVGHVTRPTTDAPGQDPICKECLARTFTAALETLGANRIECPEPKCRRRWDWRWVRKYLPEEHHNAYHEDMFKLFWSRAYKVICPKEGCGAEGYVDHQHTSGFPHVECNDCKSRICALCLVPWHKGLTCQQYRASNAGKMLDTNDMATLRMLASKGARRCPRCQMAIEKNGGCDSMFCRHSPAFYLL